AIRLSFCIAKRKPNIPPFRPPALRKRRLECIDASLRLRVTLHVGQEEAQSAHTVRLLRTRDEGPAEHGPTQQGEEASSLHPGSRSE
ncbi:MAG TPA: hypothetical protein VFW70_14175, partial [Methylomirabilota bacterium]|nr:hypothetical protein [Methylomirabilota bacterium]